MSSVLDLQIHHTRISCKQQRISEKQLIDYIPFRVMEKPGKLFGEKCSMSQPLFNRKFC